MGRDKRAFLKELLSKTNILRMHDVNRVAEQLKSEPSARVRRLRSQAILCLEDVDVFSTLLKNEFPELVYFFANYKTGTPTPSKFSDDVPIVLFSSLREAVDKAIELEAAHPAFNGPDFNRPDIICRWPWPDELVSGDPEQLIGGREFPSDIFDLAIQYRDLGRWFSLHYGMKGYVDPRVHRTSDGEPVILQRGSLSPEAYPPFQVMTFGWGKCEFFSLYDLNDSETMAFAKRCHALWRRLSTNKVAVYDPSTRKVVEPEARPGDHDPIGKRALAHALEDPPRYPVWVFRPPQKGPALMIGPRPKGQKVTETQT